MSLDLTLNTISRDQKRVRIGTCVLYADVFSQKDKYTFFVSEFSATYTLIGLPIATLRIPIGKPVGVLSEAAQIYNIKATHIAQIPDIYNYFNKYKEVYVFAYFPGTQFRDTTDFDTAFTYKDATRVLFRGYISNVSVSVSGEESISVELTLVHHLLSLASGSALFSNVIHGAGFYNIDVTPLSSYVSADNKNLVAKHLSPDPYNIFKGIAKEYISIFEARRKVLANTVLTDDSNVNRILSSFSTSANKLDEIKSLTSLRYTGDASTFIQYNLADFMISVLTEASMTGNLLECLLKVANTISSVFIFTNRYGYMIPLDPFWPSNEIVNIPAGSIFNQSIEFQTTLYGYDVTGTIACVPTPSGYVPSTKDHDKVITMYTSWLLPESEAPPSHSFIDVAYFPAWLVSSSNLAAVYAIAENPPTPQTQSDSASPQSPDTSAQQKKPIETLTEVSKHFAFYHTLYRNTYSHGLQCVTTLRDDLVPGMNVGVHVIAADDSYFSVYGMISEVIISVSALNRIASTTFKLSHVRNKALQSVIDTENRPHFVWNRVASKVRDLRLWDSESKNT